MHKEFNGPTENTPDEAPGQTRSGNRCGHDPNSPRFFCPPPDHDPRPSILRRLIDRANEFFEKPEKIPSLNGAHHARQLQEDPDHKDRQMRSERREACCSLLAALLHYCDLVTLIIGVPQEDGSLLPLTLKTLAERAGIGLRRAERAIRDLIDAGLLTSHPRAELQPETGTYIGHAAIRVVPPSLFGMFGLEDALGHERKRASQKRTKEQKERQPTRTAKARIKTAISGAINKLTGRTPKPPSPDATHFDLERPFGPADATAADHIQKMRELLEGKAPPGPAQPSPKVERDQAAAGSAEDEPPARARSRDPP